MITELYRSRFRKFTQLAALLCTATYLNGQEVLFRQVADTKTNTHIEVTSLFSDPSLGGFLPVRVVIANHQKISHSVYLSFQSSSDYQGNLSTSSEFPFFIEPGKTITTDILVPLSPENGTGSYQPFKASLSGSMGKNQHSDTIRFTANQPAVLLSDTLHTPNGSALDTELGKRISGSSGSNLFASRFNPKQLPDDWRAFSGFDSIMMTDNDWSETPPGSRNAITSWLLLGGQLIIYSPNSPTPSSLGFPTETSFGKIHIKPIYSNHLDPKPTVDLAFQNGGQKTRIDAVSNDFKSTWPLQDELGDKSFNSVFFILILIAFGIIVGPVNLFVFAKSGRRHRLFITTPLISIATSLILIVLIIFQDGFGGEGNRIVLMEVRPDQNQNAAFIHQEQFSRTGVMTSPSFSIDASTLIVPTPIRSSRWSRFTDDYETRGNYDLQPSRGKLFASGSWFQSRSEQGQLLSAVVPTRGRIETTNQPNTLVSSFDFPIDTLLFKDENGQWHRAENVSVGKPVTLTSIDPTMVQPILNKLSAKLTKRNQTFLNKVQERDGCFIATTTAASAIETHPSINWKETTTIITGPVVK